MLKLKIALFIYTTVFRSLFTPAFRSTKTKKCTNYSHRIIKTGVKDVHNRYIIFTEASNLACLRKMFALNKRNFCRQWKRLMTVLYRHTASNHNALLWWLRVNDNILIPWCIDNNSLICDTISKYFYLREIVRSPLCFYVKKVIQCKIAQCKK